MRTDEDNDDTIDEGRFWCAESAAIDGVGGNVRMSGAYVGGGEGDGLLLIHGVFGDKIVAMMATKGRGLDGGGTLKSIDSSIVKIRDGGSFLLPLPLGDHVGDTVSASLLEATAVLLIFTPKANIQWLVNSYEREKVGRVGVEELNKGSDPLPLVPRGGLSVAIGKEKEVITVEVNILFLILSSNLAPNQSQRKRRADYHHPPSNDPSDTSLAVKMELLVAKPPELIPSTVNSKAPTCQRTGERLRNLLERSIEDRQRGYTSTKRLYRCLVFMIALGSAGPTERNGAGDDADEE
ncbi:hypothetical protein F4604DRAFT_1907788 [Suillus subluteus]|nr:hypothetical protein F4604DRAFT_1907788 [Suillus subluteus]